MPKLQEREDEDQRESKEFDLGFDEPETPLPLTVTSRVCVFFSSIFLIWVLFNGFDLLIGEIGYLNGKNEIC